MAKNDTSPHELNGNPLTTLYDKFNVIANISRNTEYTFMPAALLFDRIFKICGTFTNIEPAMIP